MGNRHPRIAPYETYAAADGEFALAVGNDALFARLCGALGRAELADDARFATNAARARAPRRARRGARGARSPTAPAAELGRAPARRPACPPGAINDVAQAFALAEPLGLAPVDETDGVRTVRSPMRLDAHAGRASRAARRAWASTTRELRAWLAASRPGR